MYEVNVDETLQTLRENEDTDNNGQITIEDEGPKVGLFAGCGMGKD